MQVKAGVVRAVRMPPPESFGMETNSPVFEAPPTKSEPMSRVVVRWLLLLLAVGFGVDACSGLPVTRGARSGLAWLGAVLAFGALYWAGEGLGERLCAWDKKSDPLWKRSLFLVALLAFWAIVLVAFQVVFRLAT